MSHQEIQPDSRSALSLAFSWPVVRRALFFGVVVGAILNYINHANCCLSIRFFSEPPVGCLKKMFLTSCVPYVVSTISSVMALRQKSS